MELSRFKNKHRGERIVVCGLGESILSFDPTGEITIGVNDIGRAFDPTYLLSVNNKSQLKGDRFQYVENSKAQCCFTHNGKECGDIKIPVVQLRFGGETGAVQIKGDRFPHFRTSAYVGVALAAYMGAKIIGLIGVDFSDGHFWAKDGPHRLQNEFDRINQQFGKLAAYLLSEGQCLVNLSSISKLTTLPKVTLEQWKKDGRPKSPSITTCTPTIEST